MAAWDRLKEDGHMILSKTLNDRTPVRFKSPCGHFNEMYPVNIRANYNRNGSFVCPKCHTRLDNEEIKEMISSLTEKEYKLVSAKGYSSARNSKIKVLHKTCGNIFDTTVSNFKLGKRCPKCARKSSESKISQLFERTLKHIGIEFEVEKKFDDLINPFSTGQMRFDYYFPKLKLLVEIDGRQHFIPVNRFGGKSTFISTKYRDFLKNKYAVEKGLKLIRVPLWNIYANKTKPYEESRREIFNLILFIAKESNLS